MSRPSNDCILAKEVRRMLEAGHRVSEIKVLLTRCPASPADRRI